MAATDIPVKKVLDRIADLLEKILAELQKADAGTTTEERAW